MMMHMHPPHGGQQQLMQQPGQQQQQQQQEMLPPNHRMMSPHGVHPGGHPGHPGHPGHGGGQHPMMGPPPHLMGGGGKIYPANQPMIFNPQNPNAPPIHPCGLCHREVQGDSEEG